MADSSRQGLSDPNVPLSGEGDELDFRDLVDTFGLNLPGGPAAVMRHNAMDIDEAGLQDERAENWSRTHCPVANRLSAEDATRANARIIAIVLNNSPF